ncbi:hypothetical protein EIP75_23515 [Aquabacterium soli]|uniref:Uncharacterized protein n=1 Tax=Aquabacterium soli TaxID=2493092 RepID=A0A3R8T869_9BURK|nr:hypothetical protein [Aquabacterium soli]RRR99926.1 hypothetical protein EIP75_23515 [Aquabacterium soli]
MAPTKGPMLEELVRAYFARQGFYVLRSVPFRFEGEDVTDVDVWLYGRQAASSRIRGIVDVKNKRSPKAFERVLWVKGLQAVINCDRAIIATTDTNSSLVKFAQAQKIAVLSKNFLDRLGKKLEVGERLTLEQFLECIHAYAAQKQDGDWISVVSEAKSAVASVGGFPAFNKAMLAFRFFASRAEVRTQHRDIAVRCALLTAGLACIALDSALEKFVFEEGERRYAGIVEGVTYGDGGDGRMRQSIDVALAALAEGMQNGRAIAAQAREQLTKRLAGVRADIVAEHFAREHNAQHLFPVAKEFDDYAHDVTPLSNRTLSIEARAILGVFADFCGVSRTVLPIAVQDAGVGTPAVAQTEGPGAASVSPTLPAESALVSAQPAEGESNEDGLLPNQRPLI